MTRVTRVAVHYLDTDLAEVQSEEQNQTIVIHINTTVVAITEV